MRRFLLYKRGHVWYVQLFNPARWKYLSGKPAGEGDRRAAEHVADDLLRDEVRKPGGKTRQPAAQVFKVSVYPLHCLSISWAVGSTRSRVIPGMYFAAWRSTGITSAWIPTQWWM